MKKVKTEHLANELTVNSSVFSKAKVNVIFQGDDAGTDGSTIVLPSLTQGVDVSEGAMQVARGFVNHEAGHVAHSDMDAIKVLVDECERENNPLLRSVHNALEDVWLERRVGDEYAGAIDTLKHTTKAVNDRFLRRIASMSKAEAAEKLSDEGHIGAVALTWEGRKGYGEETNQKCLDLLPKDVRSKLPGRIKALDVCKSTEDVIELARVITRDIKEAEEEKRKPEEEPPTGTSKPCEDGEEGEAEEDGEAEVPEEGESEAVEAEAPIPNIGEVSSEGEVTEGVAEYVPEPYDPSLKAAVRDMLEEEGLMESGIVDGHAQWRPFTTAHDEVITKTDRAMKRVQNVEAYTRIVKQMSGPINAMQRKLEAGLSALMDRDWEDRQLTGRLDGRRFVGAYNCEPDVYRIRTEEPDLDTAVTIIVDMSGSMGGSPIHLAQQVCICLAETISRLGAELEVLGFTTSKNLNSNYDNKYSRTEALVHYVFKRFGERLSDSRGVMGSMTQWRMRNNVDGESVDWARSRLEQRPERKRVLLALSDGYPAYHGRSQREGNQHLRDAVARCEASNIDCVGIGIMSDAVEQFYPLHTVCHTLKDLPESVIGEMGKLLVSGRYQASNANLLKASRHARAS